MSTTGDRSSDASGTASAEETDMKLEVGWYAEYMVAERAGTELPT
jgi:hypothetical protein